ncbi:two-partner secretion domain-containing protein [Pasteurella testudinis]|uniref:two-partner secretion domain-containing protein n=1 Tax=Pasteurella testudinis TaxID=761 RepID=UPI00405A0E84
MNKHLFNVIFSKVKQLFIVVAENGRHTGKAKRNYKTKIDSYPNNSISLKISLLTISILLSLSPNVLAKIIADPSAQGEHKATILAQNGKPLINIQTPSAAGVSRNIYSQFDIDSKGAIFNNSKNNPWLEKGEAKVILNEVNSNNASKLEGQLSIQGRKADVIIANQSGININGASFTNAGRVTLTTGKANIVNGNITDIGIEKGTIHVGQKGLDNRKTDYTELLGRAAVIQGKIQAQNLNIVSGEQKINYESGIITQHKGSGSKPQIAIDVSELGGMYAGRISLLATESGVGVKNLGTLQAGDGHIVITSDGKLENRGKIQADIVNLATTRRDIDNRGLIQSKTQTVISSERDIYLSGKGLAQQKDKKGKEVNPQGEIIIRAKEKIQLEDNAHIGNSQTSEKEIVIHAGERLITGIRVKASSGGKLSVIGNKSVSTQAETEFTAKRDLVIASQNDIALIRTDLNSQHGNIQLISKLPQNEKQNDKNIIADISMEEGKLSAGKDVFIRTDRNVHLFNPEIEKVSNIDVIANGKLNYQIYTLPKTINNLTLTSESDLSLKSNESINNVNVQGDLSVTSNQGDISLSKGNVFVAKNNAEFSALSGNIYADNLTLSALNGYLSVIAKNNVVLSSVNKGMTLLSGKSGVSVGSVGNGVLTLPKSIGLTASMGAVKLRSGGDLNVDLSQSEHSRKSFIHGKGVSFFSQNGNISFRNSNLNIQEQGIKFDSRRGTTTLDNVTAASTGDITLSSQSDISLNNVRFKARNIIASSNKEIKQNKGMNSSNTLTATDILSLYAGSYQYLNNTTLQGGAVTITAKHGGINIQGATDWKSVGSEALKNNPQTRGFNGAFNIDVKNHLTFLPQHKITASSDLSIRSLNNLVFKGVAGKSGNASAKVVSLYAGGKLNLTGGTVTLEATNLKSNHINITSTASDIQLKSLKNGTEKYSNLNKTVSILQEDINRLNKELEVVYDQYDYFPGDYITPEMSQLQRKIDDIKKFINLISSPKKGYEHLGAKLTARMINLLSQNSISIESAKITASDKVNIKALGTTPAKDEQRAYGVLINGSLNVFEKGKDSDNEHSYNVFNTPTEIIGRSGITIESAAQSDDSNLIISATDLQAPNGKINLYAYNDIRLESGQEEFYSYLYRSYTRGHWPKKKRITETNTDKRSVAKPTSLSAQSIDLNAGGNIDLYATNFNAPKGNVTITAGKALSLYAVDEENYHKHEKTKKSKLFGFISGGRSKSSSTKAVQSALPTRLVAKSAVTNSGWDTLLQGTQFTTLTPAQIRVGVGAQARKDAKIIFEGIKTKVTEIHRSESKSALWQSMKDRGSIVETLDLPRFNGPTPIFSAPGGFSVQIPKGTLKTEIDKLVKQSGMNYLNSFVQRKDVDWKPIQLEYDKWNYSQQGLSGAGAAIVAIAVAVATSGAGAAALPGLATTVTSEAMLNAAMTSLVTQASISTINNRGDLGKVFKELGSKSAVKSLATAVVTAGALSKVQALSKMQTWSNSEQWADKLSYNLVNSGITALGDATINGKSLEESLKRGLLGAVVTTAHGEIASHIKGLEKFGDNAFIQQFSHKLAHAVAGCGAGAAVGGKCVDGAVGAVVGEVTAEIIGANSNLSYTAKERDQLLGYAKIAAATIVAHLGGNADTAINTAHTAVMNNYLSDWQKKQKALELERCANAICQTITRLNWQAVDTGQDASFAVGMVAAVPEELYDTVEGIATLLANPLESIRAVKVMLTQDNAWNKMVEGTKQHFIQTLTKLEDSYQRAGYDGAFDAGKEAGRILMNIIETASGGGAVLKQGSKLVLNGLKQVKAQGKHLVPSATALRTCSFRGDMEVKTHEGYVLISQLKAGDKVFAKNEITGIKTYQRVEAQYSNPYDYTVYIRIKNSRGGYQTIVSNRIHPFFVQTVDNEQPQLSAGHGYQGDIAHAYWVNAENLKAGYKLLSENEEWQTVEAVQIKAEKLKAYNLTVAHDHTYFIKGAAQDTQGVWVHNDCWHALPKDAKAVKNVDGYNTYQFKDQNGKSVTVIQKGQNRFETLNHKASEPHFNRVFQQIEASTGRYLSTGNTVDHLYSRSYLRSETMKKIFANYEALPNGDYFDIVKQKTIKGPIDIGHAYGWEHRRLSLAAKELKWSQQQFNDYVNARPEKFRLENMSRNRSHVDEMPGNGDIQTIKIDMEKFLIRGK